MPGGRRFPGPRRDRRRSGPGEPATQQVPRKSTSPCGMKNASKLIRMDRAGIEPAASRMPSVRSTTDLSAPSHIVRRDFKGFCCIFGGILSSFAGRGNPYEDITSGPDLGREVRGKGEFREGGIPRAAPGKQWDAGSPEDIMSFHSNSINTFLFIKSCLGGLNIKQANTCRCGGAFPPDPLPGPGPFPDTISP